MKKIPTLFKKNDVENHKQIVCDEVTPGMEWVLKGEGIATVKIDGSATAIIKGKFYKRYDAKGGKKPPSGAIPCQESPDPITTHWPHWVLVDEKASADLWFVEAYKNTEKDKLFDGTYEAIGPHFSANPYNLDKDILVRHGIEVIEVKRSYEGIKEYLQNNYIEGIVFWKDNEPRCKIRRKDFGFKWK